METDISVKLNAIDTKCQIFACHETGKGAKFGEFWPLGGAKKMGSLYLLNVYNRGLKLNLPGGRWRQSLGEAGPYQVFHKKTPIFSTTLLTVL